MKTTPLSKKPVAVTLNTLAGLPGGNENENTTAPAAPTTETVENQENVNPPLQEVDAEDEDDEDEPETKYAPGVDAATQTEVKTRGVKKGDYFKATQRVATLIRLIPNGRKIKWKVEKKVAREIDEIISIMQGAKENGAYAALSEKEKMQFVHNLGEKDVGGRKTLEEMQSEFGPDFTFEVSQAGFREWAYAFAQNLWNACKPHDMDAINSETGKENGVYTDATDPTYVAPVPVNPADEIATLDAEIEALMNKRDALQVEVVATTE